MTSKEEKYDFGCCVRSELTKTQTRTHKKKCGVMPARSISSRLGLAEGRQRELDRAKFKNLFFQGVPPNFGRSVRQCRVSGLGFCASKKWISNFPNLTPCPLSAVSNRSLQKKNSYFNISVFVEKQNLEALAPLLAEIFDWTSSFSKFVRDFVVNTAHLNCLMQTSSCLKINSDGLLSECHVFKSKTFSIERTYPY